MHGKTFARYILKDEVTGEKHPEKSSILYVSLQKLSLQKDAAGEMALYLLGNIKDLKNNNAKKIAEIFSTSFDDFKKDKDVVNVLSLAERYTNEGEARGVERGANRLAELINNGLSITEALEKIKEEQKEIVSKS